MATLFTSALSPLCPLTVVWERKTGRDQYAKTTYALPVTFAPPTGGRRQFKMVRKSAGPNAVDFVQGSIIYVLAVLDVNLEDRVYIQGDSQPYPPILSWDSPTDETGARAYTKITLGSALG